MKILMTGATGFLGQALARRFTEQGHQLTVLSRNANSAKEKLGIPCQAFSWDPVREPAPSEAFDGVNAVIHLAGEPVAATRWSTEIKKRIHDSRAVGTRNLVTTLNRLSVKPETLISASAIGYYGSQGDRELTEAALPGKGFLASVCQAWESEARQAHPDVRTLVFRIGIVLGQGGGALEKMLPPFKAGLGGPIGDGKHWMSWIHIDDVVELFVLALENRELKGTVNAVSPHPVTNAEFSHALGAILHRPVLMRVPVMALKFAFGEMAEDALLASARVIPQAAQSAGFNFKHPDVKDALKSLF